MAKATKQLRVIDPLLRETSSQLHSWSMEKSIKFLEEKITKNTPKRTTDQIRRAFVPFQVFSDSIYLTSTLLVGPPGYAKTTIARYWATALTDDWLIGSIFTKDPLVIFTNSLRMGFKKVKELYDGHDYIFFFVDDAIRYQGSKAGTFSKRSAQLSVDLAEIRHILEDDCGVKPPACVNLIWATQRFKELSTFARSCDRAVYKGLAVLGPDKQAIYQEVGPEAYTWLLQINRMVKHYQKFEYLSHFVLVYDPEEDPDYCVVQADITDYYEFPFYREVYDKSEVQKVTMAIIKEKIEDERFPRIISRSLGVSIAKDTIRQLFPETTVNMQEVIDKLKHYYYLQGKTEGQQSDQPAQYYANMYKFRFWRVMGYVERMMPNEPIRTAILAALGGFNGKRTLRKFLRAGEKDYQRFNPPDPPTDEGMVTTEIPRIWRELSDEINQYYSDLGYKKDGTFPTDTQTPGTHPE